MTANGQYEVVKRETVKPTSTDKYKTVFAKLASLKTDEALVLDIPDDATLRAFQVRLVAASRSAILKGQLSPTKRMISRTTADGRLAVWLEDRHDR
jgi:hypothetical protein